MTGAELIALLELAGAATSKIWTAVEAAKAGKADAAAVMASLGSLHAELAAHNAKHQADLDAKFDGGDEG